MAVARTRTFRSGNSEAVRLPKDVAFGPDVELIIVRSGDVLTMYPATSTVHDMIGQLASLPKPREVEIRDDELIDERSGL